uniref:DNL-type domain-containing protein n=1 Tax=Sexangularia sp. CB-2014 TaxID=1486929 RepID=A0A7S1YBS7_9EUKA|mmetsp:Transcript_14723/g.46217  ORF Transcript_14723/g.46217 Transcript_14723/m.46217 type:complete len:207 (+) Transcript_14723:75-695(+)
MLRFIPRFTRTLQCSASLTAVGRRGPSLLAPPRTALVSGIPRCQARSLAKFSTLGKLSAPAKLALLFTCTKCETRQAKSFSKQAYEHGIVIAVCTGCRAKHLIADHLGWFPDGDGTNSAVAPAGKITDFLAESGVKRVRDAEDEASGTISFVAADCEGGAASSTSVANVSADALSEDDLLLLREMLEEEQGEEERGETAADRAKVE